ncbi:efflux RND transporter periplasmic adaptor subunit [Marinobacter xestospongiae]|uniref:efflux RND transporter periplasmic adaptor subunit n=1 Tax=Marinobacter xestospongiae TaxID=994319 RepID=UPI00200565DE|nr:efflux RND transporter periplasmic adaptor subunit [Marinobacter xestospongiae]MCK7567240.1 efflux RND transporter periplasmic adaptor subunit [Marinobacter xestospongiae]
MNSTLRILPWIFLVLLLGACGEAPDTPAPAVVQPVKILTLGGSGQTLSREFPGTVRATQRVSMAFQVPGRLVEFPVKEGQQVQAGDQLGLLDDADYRSNLAAAQADLTRTEANFKRAQELIGKNYVSQAEFDSIRASYNIAQSNLEKARKALNDTRLIAPFDGVVARTLVQNFEEVQAKQPVLSLQNNNELEVIVNVPESLVVRHNDAEGLQLTGTFEGIPGVEFPLEIKEFATEANPETQTFDYVLSIQQTEGYNVLPGMTANVRAAQTSLEGSDSYRITLPLAALTPAEDSQPSVWLLDDDNRVHRQPVETGEFAGQDSIIVSSGLTPGDRVVIAGVSALREGMQVKPIDKVEF